MSFILSIQTLKEYTLTGLLKGCILRDIVPHYFFTFTIHRFICVNVGELVRFLSPSYSRVSREEETSFVELPTSELHADVSVGNFCL